jgi:hypothetical protein
VTIAKNQCCDETKFNQVMSDGSCPSNVQFSTERGMINGCLCKFGNESPATQNVTDERFLSEGSTDVSFHRKHGVTHISKANTSSSNRKKAAFMKSRVMYNSSSKRTKKNKNLCASKKKRKQDLELYEIMVPTIYNHIVHADELKTTILFVDGGTTTNPPINPYVSDKKNT